MWNILKPIPLNVDYIMNLIIHTEQREGYKYHQYEKVALAYLT